MISTRACRQACLLTLLVTGTLGTASASEVPRWADFSSPRPGKNPYTGVMSQAPVPLWSVPLPGPPINAASHTERSRPVVHQDSVLVGSAAGKGLYRFSRYDGALLDTYEALASVESEALVADGRVYFTDTAGRTYCYTFEGEKLWVHKTNAPILTRPTLDDGRVFITNVDDLVVAIDAQTGEQIWRYQAKRDLTRVAELALYAAPSAVVDDGQVIVGFSTGELVALAAATGERTWAVPVGEGRYPDLVGTPVIEASDILVGGYFKPLLAIDRGSQSVRWRAEVGTAFPVGVYQGLVLHPGTDGVLRAYDRLTGAEQWSWDSKTGTALTEPVVTPAGLVIGAVAGSVHVLNPETGRKRWSWREPVLLEGVNATPTVVDRQVFLVTNAGTLYAFVAPEKSERDRPTNRRIFSGDP